MSGKVDFLSDAASFVCSALQDIEDDERFWANAISSRRDECGILDGRLLWSHFETGSGIEKGLHLCSESTGTPASGASTPVSMCNTEHSKCNDSPVIRGQALSTSAFSDVVSAASQQQEIEKPSASMLAEAAVPKVGSAASPAEKQETLIRRVASVLAMLCAPLLSSEQGENAAHEDAELVGPSGNCTGPRGTQAFSTERCLTDANEGASTFGVALSGTSTSARMSSVFDQISLFPSTIDTTARCSPAVWPTYTAAFREIHVGDVLDDERAWLAVGPDGRGEQDDRRSEIANRPGEQAEANNTTAEAK